MSVFAGFLRNRVSAEKFNLKWHTYGLWRIYCKRPQLECLLRVEMHSYGRGFFAYTHTLKKGQKHGFCRPVPAIGVTEKFLTPGTPIWWVVDIMQKTAT